ncbi:MAG: hypothetical protein ACLFOY_01570 [Desulfatibacillaceae bacterium]
MRVDSLCLDCGKPTRIEVKDGEILEKEPDDLIGHVAVPVGRWVFNIPYS